MWICISTKHLQEEGVDSFVERLCYFFSIAVDIIRVNEFVGVLFSSGAHPSEASSRLTTVLIYLGGNPGGRIRHFSSPLLLLVLLSLSVRKGVMKGVLVLWSCFARFCGFAVVFRTLKFGNFKGGCPLLGKKAEIIFRFQFIHE